jgi:hypothetical protein
LVSAIDVRFDVKPVDTRLLWISLLASPLAWAFQLQCVYAVSAWFVEQRNAAPLHVVSAACLIVPLASAAIARNAWRTVGGWPTGNDAPDVGRIRFLTILGMMAGLLFACVIVAQWLAVALLPRSTGAG